jgi:hypothetical protein
MKDYNYINISKGGNALAYQLTTKSPFFQHEFQCTIDEEKIIFQRVFLDTKGKTQKAYKRNNWFYATITANQKLVFGKYYFNVDESTEDQIVIYFENETLQGL